jgi:peptidoglycan/LPS O-acetylase OafA/YrhL
VYESGFQALKSKTLHMVRSVQGADLPGNNGYSETSCSVDICFWGVNGYVAPDVGGRPLRWCGQILRSRPLTWLGAISYPLYLIHWPMIIIMLAGLVRGFPAITGTQAVMALMIGGLPLILWVSWLMHLWIELPGMALGKRLRSRPSTAALKPFDPHASAGPTTATTTTKTG